MVLSRVLLGDRHLPGSRPQTKDLLVYVAPPWHIAVSVTMISLQGIQVTPHRSRTFVYCSGAALCID